MKRIKIIIFTMFIFLMTGCSVEYNLNINEDLSLDETVIAKENTELMQEKTNLTGDAAVNYLYEMYSLDNMEFNTYDEGGYTYGVASRSFSSLKKYSNNFYSDVFYNIKITQNNGIVDIYSKQSNKLSSKGSSSPIYDSIDLNITVPFDVKSNNADKVKGSTYTWNIKKNELKTIKLSFDIKNKKNSANLKVGKNNLSINYSYIILASIGAIVLIVAVVVIINNKRNNLL